MTCQLLQNNFCALGHCERWEEWSKTSTQDNHEFCRKQLTTPLTQDQIDELQHIIFNKLTPVQNYLFILKEYPTQRENLIEYLSRCEASIDALKERLREIGI